jgi:DNA topoisomerase-2
VEVILGEFYEKRYETYRKRKAHLIRSMQGELKKLANKARFIQEIIAEKIDLRKSQNDGEVDMILEQLGFDRILEDSAVEGKPGTYKYLTEMRLNTLTKERAEKLNQERDESAAKLRELEATTLETMWLRELDALESRYAEDRQWRIQLQNPEGGIPSSNGGGGALGTVKKTKMRK